MTNVIVSYTIHLVETQFIASPKIHRISTTTHHARVLQPETGCERPAGARPHNRKTPSRGNRELLGNAHKTHRHRIITEVVFRVEYCVIKV